MGQRALGGCAGAQRRARGRPSGRVGPARWSWRGPASTTTAPCCAWADSPTPAPCSWPAGPSSRRSVPFEELGAVYGALADLEDKTGGRTQAVRWEEVALGYTYQAGDPEACAISHHNLADYLERGGAAPALVLAHRLAAAAIRVQMRSGLLPTTVNNLANSDLPAARRPSPPWSRRWSRSRACASPRSSSACPAPRRTATRRSPRCGSWPRRRRGDAKNEGRSRRLCWPRCRNRSRPRSSSRVTSSPPPSRRPWPRCPRKKPMLSFSNCVTPT